MSAVVETLIKHDPCGAVVLRWPGAVPTYSQEEIRAACEQHEAMCPKREIEVMS